MADATEGLRSTEDGFKISSLVYLCFVVPLAAWLGRVLATLISVVLAINVRRQRDTDLGRYSMRLFPRLVCQSNAAFRAVCLC